MRIKVLFSTAFLAAFSPAVSQSIVQQDTPPAPQAGVETAVLPDAPASVPSLAGAALKVGPASPYLLHATSTAGMASLPALDHADWSSSTDEPAAPTVTPPAHGGYVPLKDCPTDQTRARECRMHWGPMVLETVLYNAFEDGGNVYTGYFYRNETLTGKWWDRYLASAADWRWDRWADNNPVLDDYVGHPFMGAVTNSIWIQNDPKGMTLEFANDRPYWNSRRRALAWSTFYSFEWKLGPTGEAAVGHNGDHYFYDKGVLTNETGWVELVTTPVGGFGWTLAEDYLDKHVVTKLEDKSRNPILLTMYRFLPFHS